MVDAPYTEANGKIDGFELPPIKERYMVKTVASLVWCMCVFVSFMCEVSTFLCVF